MRKMWLVYSVSDWSGGYRGPVKFCKTEEEAEAMCKAQREELWKEIEEQGCSDDTSEYYYWEVDVPDEEEMK